MRIGRLVDKIRSPIIPRRDIRKITHLIQIGLPKEIKPALEYLVSGNVDSKTAAVIKLAEQRRKEIVNMGDRKISIWGSPKPEGLDYDSSIDARPQPGKVLQFTMERIAHTGKNQKWGTVLYLIAGGFESSVVVELGTCAGISTMYLSSAASVKMLITVEGCAELANFAEESLKTYTNVKVVNALFDEALDSQLPLLESKVDLAFIDGHHEKTAAIHYFNRLVPFLSSRAVVIFDDISWSYDMRDAWDILSKRPEFGHCVELGEIGVCVTKAECDKPEAKPKYWDLQPIVGNYPLSAGPDYWDWDLYQYS